MTTLLTLALSGFLAAAASPTTSSATGKPACSTEGSAYTDAKATFRTAQAAGQSAAQVRAAHDDLLNKKNTLICCLHPDFKSCTH